MAGRRPRPTHLKLVTANPGKRPLNKSEPKPEGTLAAPPDWFDDDHRAAWNYAIAHAPAGLLKRLDRDILRVWVCASLIHREAIRQLYGDRSKTRGGELGELPVVKRSRKGGMYPSPFISVANRQAEIMMRAAAELGFSPASRTKISIEYADPKDREADVSEKYRL